MSIEYLTFQNVGHRQQASDAELRTHETDIDNFLLAHMRALQESADNGKTPTASFRDEVAEDLFREARDASESGFLKAATAISQKLNEVMDGRAKEGLLVIFRAVLPERLVVVLKLQVANEYAAVLQRVGRGREDLRAVKDVLDAPGRIQKGILYEDDRDSSSVIARETRTSATTADYFLRAYDIVMNSRPADANLALIRAVSKAGQGEDLLGLTDEVIAALPEIPQGSTSEVLDQLEIAVPDISVVRDSVEANLATIARPIDTINPTAGVKAEVVAGPIKIVGPAQDIAENVDWDRDDEREGWQVFVRSSEEPRKRYLT